MNKILISTLCIGVLIFSVSCQKANNNLTDIDKESIIDSAKVTVQKVFELSNQHHFVEGLNYYSEDSDAYFTSNGTILTLAELKKSYYQVGTSIEVLENKIGSWKSTIISENTVAFTLPIQLKIKLIGTTEYTGQLVWTGIVQKRNEKWVVIQSHESWLNCAEVTATLTTSENN